MFLFESIPAKTYAMFFIVLLSLIGINQLARMSKIVSFGIFLILPVILTFTLWPKTAAEGSSVGTWFAWAKAYSSLAGCLGFMALRYSKKLSKNKFMLMFPPTILSINILEAVIREFELISSNGFLDGMIILGGPWNIMNGIAGILNIITLSGWVGIIVSKNKSKDMIWPDQLWFWIIAYDLWNFAYVYNCVPDHSFYAGAALLLSCTIPAFFIKKGAWLQHRAQTLGIWMIFVMSYPGFVDTSQYAVKSSHNKNALFIIALLSLAANVAVAIYHFYKIFKYKRNPISAEVHVDLKDYKLLLAQNS
ncbi:MAG: hypothetical protein JXR64_13090 [Spirochaetales bacterium]|nr:hypothetical protein [Spirochaetales bacterium]